MTAENTSTIAMQTSYGYKPSSVDLTKSQDLRRILIVDDDSALSESIKMLLQPICCPIVTKSMEDGRLVILVDRSHNGLSSTLQREAIALSVHFPPVFLVHYFEK